MGFRVAVFLGFVLLLSGGNLCSATQNKSSTNETLHQLPQDQVTTSSEQTKGHQSNQTEQKYIVQAPVTFQLRTYQLRKPADKQKLPKPVEEQTPQNMPTAQGGQANSEQTETTKLPAQGPDLSLPVKKESKGLVRFEQRMPVPAESVSARCGEGKVTIAVKQNFLGNGQLIHPSDLTLGGCAAVDTVDHILLFQTELQNCGGTVMMTEEVLIYSFPLMYAPTPIGDTFILKTNPAEVTVQCQYQRRHYVSSNALMPTWTTFASERQAEQRLHFSLHLMTEDWQSQRPSNVYFLSDVMHIEASVLQGHHVPLRIFVDSCVATVNPDPSSQPRYPFINNYGCLTDAKLTGAKSYFMQRNQEDKLHFQLKAFRFHQDDRNSIYITCHLKATRVDVPIDAQHKACSFLTEAKRWVASGGDNKVCDCCETSCSGQRRKRSSATDAELQWEGTAVLGPILLENGFLLEDLTEVPELLPEPVPQLQTQEENRAALRFTALLCGAGAALVVMLVFMSAVICRRLHKPIGYSVCT
ncbi:zona pellucida sperm-binding protein 3-like [Melanotaenia boesemani]|uniref:zona pellucida sperm-binding protein 3-like n=1 Tax=Melanotaenia boesemani TaxID=1250792 RepID=UPI001C056CDE|nr:zona pellucida sperm-binding protein 3-like [Melanotaenia boesemani]